MYIANDDEKLEYALGSIQITNSKSNVDVGYVVKPEIIYQFKPQEKIANPLISNIFTILTLSPWVFLISTVCDFNLVDQLGHQS
jgi:hypothetical protein